VLPDLRTTNVSASGLEFKAPEPHGLELGARFEVRLLAETSGRGAPNPVAAGDSILMRTDATLVRVSQRGGAVQFDAPLKY